MKQWIAVFMAVTFMAATMGGCSTSKSFGPAMTTGGEGAAKQSVPTPGATRSGAITTGSEGATKQPMPMGISAPSEGK